MKVEQSRNAFEFNHVPVLANEVIESINRLPRELLINGIIIDATIGGGGHSAQILERFQEIRIIGIDQDPIARTAAMERLKIYGDRIKILGINFADFEPTEKVIMVFADLGVSSYQLDEASRGFSFKNNGPIDMRMNPKRGINAAELIEQLDEKDLANTIYKFGEEKLSRRIARKIKNDLSNEGPYEGTKALAYAIAGCYPPSKRKGAIHPATRTFQALRIAVNHELDVLDNLLTRAPEWILPGGLFEIISFHSLEDRKVKYSFRDDKRLHKLTSKPIRANAQETLINPRSRSAKLRISMKQ